MTVKNIRKILVLGSTGLVGSRFLDLFKNDFLITSIGRNNSDIKIDITSKEEISEFIKKTNADFVINFSAFTNVDLAEKEKGDRRGEVYTMNTLLPKWLAATCRSSGKILYHISTDYVFDGKSSDKPYTEKDTPVPVDSWYSQTKFLGENEVLNVFTKDKGFAIIRVSYPYSGVYQRKLDIARFVVDKLKLQEPYFAISDQKIKPVSVDDIAASLALLINKNCFGIFHVAGNFHPDQFITPFEFAKRVSEVFKLNSDSINAMTFSDFSKKRISPRPQHTWLDTTKIEGLGMKFTALNDSLNRFKQQLLTPG